PLRGNPLPYQTVNSRWWQPAALTTPASLGATRRIGNDNALTRCRAAARRPSRSPTTRRGGLRPKGSGRENVINHEGDRRANRCNGQLRADGKYQPVPVHRPVK